MTASAHAVIGAAIVTKIPDLSISLPLVLLSHILGDLPNHWDTGHNWRQKGMATVFRDTTVDLSLSFALVAVVFIFLLGQDPVKMSLAIFTSQFFDYLEAPHFFLHWKNPPWSWIDRLTHLYHKKLPTINLTLPVQILLACLFVLWSFT